MKCPFLSLSSCPPPYKTEDNRLFEEWFCEYCSTTITIEHAPIDFPECYNVATPEDYFP